MICERCGREIPKERLYHKARTVKYCSRECYIAATEREDYMCHACGMVFKPKRVGQKYCSISCANTSPRVYTPRPRRRKTIPDFKYNNHNESIYGLGDGVAGIYKITNNINGKIYIGKSKNIGHRLNQHRQNARRGTMPIYRAFRKYGLGNFTFEIIYIASDVLSFELCSLERKYIKQYKSNNPRYGYNATDGGDGGELNDIAKAKFNTIVKSDAWRKRISENKKKWWAENRDEIMDSIKARVEIRKLSQTSKQANIKKIKKRDTKKVCCIEKQCTFDSMTDAAVACRTRESSIWQVCNGRNEYAGGLRFYWVDNKPMKFVKKQRRKLTKEERMEYINQSIAKGFAKKIVCVDTGIIYRSCGEAAIILNINVSKIRQNIYDPKRCTSVSGLHFRFLDSASYRPDTVPEKIVLLH